MIIPPDSTLLFIGDSITDAGRDPAGEATPWNPRAGTGHGYVSLVEAWLGATRPADRVRVVNRGTSGHTVRDLAARWQTDVIDRRPEWLSIMIGINDVWRQFDTPLRTELAVPLAEYRETLAGLVARAKPGLRGLLLATPFFIEPNRSDPMRRRMDEYADEVRKLAAAQGAVLVDTQAAFDEVLVHTHPMTLAWDRIHPNTTGHLVIARAFLRALQAL